MSEIESMEYSRNRFVISSAVLVIWLVLIFALPGFQFGLENRPIGDLVTHSVNVSLPIGALFLLLTVAALSWWQPAGLNSAGHDWKLVWFPFLIISLIFAVALRTGLPNWTALVIVLFNALLVGINQELMFRGILFQGVIERFGIWPSIIVTSVLFGLAHASSGLLSGDLRNFFAAAVTASLSGFWLMALRIRTGSLVPAIVAHWLWDFAVFLLGISSGGIQLFTGSLESRLMLKNFAAPLVLVLPLFVYGVVLLRETATDTR